MKKEFLIYILSFVLGFCLILGGILHYRELGIKEIMLCGLFIVGSILKIDKEKSRIAGLPSEDELSKIIKLKAAAKSFYYSFVWWTILLFIGNFIKMDFRELINIGISGMLVLFGIFWLYFRVKGRVNE